MSSDHTHIAFTGESVAAGAQGKEAPVYNEDVLARVDAAGRGCGRGSGAGSTRLRELCESQLP